MVLPAAEGIMGGLESIGDAMLFGAADAPLPYREPDMLAPPAAEKPVAPPPPAMLGL